MTPDIRSGLIVIHGNKPEALREVLAGWLRRYPLMPLEQECVLVQSGGIGQWLKLALAGDVAAGGCGIAANLQMALPAQFLWQSYRSVLGAAAVPETSPFDKPRLHWRLMRLLPELLELPAFRPLRQFLEGDTDLRKRHQLAERLADLLDQYQVYRADWLADWAAGRDVIATTRDGMLPIPESAQWQPQLWRALLADVGSAARSINRAELHRRFVEGVFHLAAEPRPAGLPRRITIFGVSSLPKQALEALSALGQWCQVLMFVHNPCEYYWADIISDQDLLRTHQSRQARKPGGTAVLDEASLHLHAHPLLAAWGRQGRDFIGLLESYDNREQYQAQVLEMQQRIDLFDSNGDAALLNQLQEDIRELRPLGETQVRWPAIDPKEDRSIRFHLAHSAQREVEVLHDALLDALSADPGLRPRDIIVMVPDINAYAPHIQAVFGRFDPSDGRYIPYSVADQGQRHHDPLLGALECLLGLPQSRIAVSDVLGLLEVPALRRRFDIEEEDLPLLQRWIQAANVRWGLHDAHRQSLGLPEQPDQNSWRFGLHRMLLGYAVGAGEDWQGIEPLDEIGGLDASRLGPLVALLESLEASWQSLATPATPELWGERLRRLMADSFAADEDDARDGYTLVRLEVALQGWLDSCRLGGFSETLPLSVVRDHWLAQIDDGGLNQPFFAGAVTFATLMPMRAIPFRRVCLLGMNDGDYPRQRMPMDFDLMHRDYRPGDRSRREDDRYLFLEALLSARDHLHISWIARSVNDNSERPPSVLVAQLRDHLAAGWCLRGTEPNDAADRRRAGKALVSALSIEHRLQAFDRAYFEDGSPLASHADEWREGWLAVQKEAKSAVLAPLVRDEPITLRLLQDFLKDPTRSFFQQRLGVVFGKADSTIADHEPFILDALENWQLQDELIAEQRAALDAGLDRQLALDSRLACLLRRGELPAGPFAAAAADALSAPMQDLFERYEKERVTWPQAAADEEIDRTFMVDGQSVRLSDWLGQMRCNAEGARGRILVSSTGLLEAQSRRYRRDRLLPYWVEHLVGHLAGASLTTVIVSKNGTVTLFPLSAERVHLYWQTLLESWLTGMRRPLPLAVRSGYAYLREGGASTGQIDDPAALAARATYEVHQPNFHRHAEVHDNPYLQRAWPNFEALWANGEFARLAELLLGPLNAELADAARDRR